MMEQVRLCAGLFLEAYTGLDHCLRSLLSEGEKFPHAPAGGYLSLSQVWTHTLSLSLSLSLQSILPSNAARFSLYGMLHSAGFIA